MFCDNNNQFYVTPASIICFFLCMKQPRGWKWGKYCKYVDSFWTFWKFIKMKKIISVSQETQTFLIIIMCIREPLNDVRGVTVAHQINIFIKYIFCIQNLAFYQTICSRNKFMYQTHNYYFAILFKWWNKSYWLNLYFCFMVCPSISRNKGRRIK